MYNKKLDANGNATDADNDQSMFVLTINDLRKKYYKRWKIIKKQALNKQIQSLIN